MLTDQPAIHHQRHLGLVGVHLDFSFGFGPFCIAAAAQVHEGLLAPGRLIQIERVLAKLSVHGDQPLLVHALFAAFIPPVGGKVEQIPHMGGPQPGTMLDAVQKMLMVYALVFFGIIAAFGVRGMKLRIGVRTVFREAHHTIWILGMVFIKKAIILGEFAQVPAEIQIIAGNIG